MAITPLRLRRLHQHGRVRPAEILDLITTSGLVAAQDGALRLALRARNRGVRRAGSLAGQLGAGLVITLVAAHLFAFGLLTSRATIPAVAAVGLAMLALAARLDLLGPLGA